jgi:hypothetical protein
MVNAFPTKLRDLIITKVFEDKAPKQFLNQIPESQILFFLHIVMGT